MSKSYSDVRMELERIANQRRSFIQNSDLLRAEIVSSRRSFDASRKPSAAFLSNASSPGLNLSEKLSLSTSMSEMQHPVNIYFRDNRDRSVSSSGYSPNTTSFRRDLDRSSSSSYSPPLAVSNHFQSAMSPLRSIGTASSVIGTFRQLQARSRKIEQDRTDAMRERCRLIWHLWILFNIEHIWNTFSHSNKWCSNIYLLWNNYNFYFTLQCWCNCEMFHFCKSVFHYIQQGPTVPKEQELLLLPYQNIRIYLTNTWMKCKLLPFAPTFLSVIHHDLEIISEE